MAALEVDLSKIEMGQTVTVKWRGKPVFVRRRSEQEVEAASKARAACCPSCGALPRMQFQLTAHLLCCTSVNNSSRDQGSAALSIRDMHAYSGFAQ